MIKRVLLFLAPGLMVGALMAAPALAEPRTIGPGPAAIASKQSDVVVQVDAVTGLPYTAAAPLPTANVAPAASITASSGNVANANAVATLAAVAAKTTYIAGFQCTAAGSTAGLDVSLTVAGVITGTMTYTFTFPVGVLAPSSPLVVNFTSPVPASAVNTAIVVTLPAGGTGNTNASCSAQGYQA